MRKVLIYEGALHQDRDRVQYGYFHSFSIDSEELDVGALQYPVAIIEEAKTGSVRLISAHRVKFELRTDDELEQTGELINWQPLR
jgi:hypothetical protein